MVDHLLFGGVVGHGIRMSTTAEKVPFILQVFTGLGWVGKSILFLVRWMLRNVQETNISV